MEKYLAVLIVALALVGCGPVDKFDDLSVLATGQMRTFEFHASPIPAATEPFLSAEGQEVRIEDFQGKVLLVNIWATWCAPCIREMPQLDILAQAMVGTNFALVAISTDRLVEDRLERSDVETFLYDEIGATHIPLYTDWPISFTLASGVSVWPTTILYDRQGRELGRINGPADWDSEDAMRMIQGVIEATQE